MSSGTSSKTHSSLKLPTSFAVIFGSFNLGLFVAIQGPTLMDLIDLLHINNDTMSVTLAFASLAYSVGGLLSGLLFNYVTRPILIAILFCSFGLCNIVTPFISNYLVFTVITCFKMICAGGTDCGANVWILDIWPGKDEWLQALHFTFAVGTALGPLIVEPFLSADYAKAEQENGHSSGGGLIGIKDKTSGSSTISDQNNETRIHVPFIFSGLLSVSAGFIILYLHLKSERAHRADPKTSPLQLELGQQQLQLQLLKTKEHTKQPQDSNSQDKEPESELMVAEASPEKLAIEPAPSEAAEIKGQLVISKAAEAASVKQQVEEAAIGAEQPPQPPQPQQQALNSVDFVEPIRLKITSRSRDDHNGRPPYYVMFAVALAAMSLSFYCGIEITSMNYLATFAVNIDLQLSKSTAALMSSALTISFAVGRGAGVYMGARMKPHKLFYFCTSTMITGNILMLCFANSHEILLWFSVCLFGLGCAPLYPAVVSFFDYKITKVTNTVSGIFISGSMFNVALNSLIIGHHIIDNALILLFCNLAGSIVLLFLFGTLHMLTKVKTNQRVKKYELKQKKSIEQLQLRASNTNQEQPESTPTNNPQTPAIQNTTPATQTTPTATPKTA